MQMVCTVLFYRRAKMEGASVATPTLWGIAAAWSLIADAVWWYATGTFDPSGGIVGLSSAALTVGGELLCQQAWPRIRKSVRAIGATGRVVSVPRKWSMK